MPLEFTNNWFESLAKPNWDQLIPQLNPRRILEIGSYEGASTCYLINALACSEADLEIHCVDTWEGGIEHQAGAGFATDMNAVEARFNRNVELAIDTAQPKGATITVSRHKQLSYQALAELIQQGKQGYFDFFYVDGSHQAPDVLSDAVMGYHLLRTGGIIAFDDYLWSEHAATVRDPLRCPKPAIDAFSNIFFRKVTALAAPLGQVYFLKTSA